ncbi:YcbK family protein [Ahrensia marina]|uniref:YcbK family protein n=1 Tax=Ahrensia marina TaxID=1514904 RepID=UPI0006B4B075|nr:D-Ala-D-Ala carboxypeptidase family metallohydrolase [Ahrensia marina]
MRFSRTLNFVRHQSTVIFLTFIAVATATNAQSGALKSNGNPWHALTDGLMDHDHGHLLREPSPFDDMSAVQLAALPKGRRIHFNAPSKCVPARLKKVLNSVAAKYGPITVNSTFRSSKRNRKIGGKKRSWHLKCGAVDFRVHAGTKGLLSYLRKNKNVGGYKRYRSGFYHIDVGPKRTW